MSNKIYVSYISEEYVGIHGMIYAGNSIDTAFERIRKKAEYDDDYTLDYYVDVWENGEKVDTYWFDDEADFFVSGS